MPVRTSILLVVVAMVAVACSPTADKASDTAQPTPQVAPSINNLWEQANLRFNPIPAAAENPDNPLTEAKVALGKALYYDTRLSEDGTISCNSCHDLATFGVDNRAHLGWRRRPNRRSQFTHGAQCRFSSVPVLGWTSQGCRDAGRHADPQPGGDGHPERGVPGRPSERHRGLPADVCGRLSGRRRAPDLPEHREGPRRLRAYVDHADSVRCLPRRSTTRKRSLRRSWPAWRSSGATELHLLPQRRQRRRA